MRCEQCGGGKMVRLDKPRFRNWECGCKYHGPCPACATIYARIKRWFANLFGDTTF